MTAKRILIMDDEPDFAEFAGEVAVKMGYEVTVLNDSLAFRDIYQEINPDMIILDIMMPNVDGIELIEWLSAVDNEARVLIVTGYNPHFADAAKIFASVKGRFSVSTLMKPITVRNLRGALT